MFRRITIPLMSPILLYNLVICLVVTFQYFTQAYTMTNGRGDPNNATLFLNLNLFREAFVFNHMGYGAAIAWLLFVIVLVLTLGIFLLARKRVYYAGGER
jgi:multiple sugar transport system permease protein